jgi:hypothetical protein
MLAHHRAEAPEANHSKYIDRTWKRTRKKASGGGKDVHVLSRKHAPSPDKDESCTAMA